jgi:hypothetical protein
MDDDDDDDDNNNNNKVYILKAIIVYLQILCQRLA